MHQHQHAIALGALVLACATYLGASLMDIRDSVGDLAQSLAPRSQTVEVTRMTDHVCIPKEVKLGGLPVIVTFYCYRLPGETAEEFGKRCREELAAFCEGFED